MENLKKEIWNILGASGNTFDIYNQIYIKYIKDNLPDSRNAFRITLDYPYEVGDSKDQNPVAASLEKIAETNYRFNRFTTGIVDRLSSINLSEDDFYEQLFCKFFESDDPVYPQTDIEKVTVLSILAEKTTCIPYFQFKPGIEVTKEDYTAKVDDLVTYVQEAQFMWSYNPFNNYPEQAAQLYRIVQEIEGEKNKVIFLAMMISYLKNRKKD